MMKSNSPARILYLLWSGNLGGAERHVFDLVTSLPADRYSPTVCFLQKRIIYAHLFGQAEIPAIELNWQNGYDLAGMVRFATWLHKEKFEVIHSHGTSPWSILVAKMVLPQAHVIYTEHSREHQMTQRRVGRISARFVDQYIAVSRATQDALRKDIGIDDTRVTVIPNFVDASRFNLLSEYEIGTIRTSLGIPLSSRVLISVGRLIASKNYSCLINLLIPLFRKYSDLYLLIVGDGVMRISLSAEINRAQLQDRIWMLGNRLDVPDLLAASDVFVFLSRVETFGIAVLEAMTSGKPVVALRIPGLDEVVVSGETGIMVDETNLENDFVSAVDDLLQNPVKRTRMGIAGRERALAKYEKNTVVEKIIALYDRVLQHKPSEQVS